MEGLEAWMQSGESRDEVLGACQGTSSVHIICWHPRYQHLYPPGFVEV
jgi:hypothetical protein